MLTQLHRIKFRVNSCPDQSDHSAKPRQCLSSTQTQSHLRPSTAGLILTQVSGVSSTWCLELFPQHALPNPAPQGNTTIPKSPTAALILSIHPSCRQSHQNLLAFSFFARAESEHKAMMLQPRNAGEEMGKRILNQRPKAKATLHLFTN